MSDHLPISVTILTKNNQSYIAQCLDALTRFDEVIILDTGSTDETVSIAQTYPNVRVCNSEFIGFGPLKNLAASYASNDWIFSLDSDEVASDELVENLSNARLKIDEVGVVRRNNYYNQKLINACGWQNDFIPRIYNKTHTEFTDKRVHEGIFTKNSRTILIRGSLRHFPYRDASDLIRKMHLYSSLFAEENRLKKRSSPFKAISIAIATFIKSYFIKKGFLYGYEGLLISVSHANLTFYKYMKLYEANKHLTASANHDL